MQSRSTQSAPGRDRSSLPEPFPPDRGTRILRQSEIQALLSLEDCIEAVEGAFRAHAGGATIPPGVLGTHVEGGGFHIKSAGLLGERAFYAAKINGNFFHNAERFGLPRIQGLIVLSDARNGTPLAVMDSIHITLLRTAASSAVAARFLACPDSSSVTLCGCGEQGSVQLAALRCVLPIRSVFLFDRDRRAAEKLAAQLAAGLNVEIVEGDGLSRALRSSQVCITCTPSRTPLFGSAGIRPGTFIAAVGADSEEKQELAVELFARSRVVVDHLEQCATIGDLHHALAAGVVRREDVHAELHEVVSGLKPGRTSEEEIFVFDSTGVALQDVAAAVLVYQRALAADAGTVVHFQAGN